MNRADEILKRYAELRACTYPPHGTSQAYTSAYSRAVSYLANIAAAERALIEAVGAWFKPNQQIATNVLEDNIDQAYRALLAAMAEAQR